MAGFSYRLAGSLQLHKPSERWLLSSISSLRGHKLVSSIDHVLSDLDLQAHQPSEVNIEELRLLIQEARNPTKSEKPRAARRTANSAGEWLCGSCGHYLPVEAFWTATNGPAGRFHISSSCKDCTRLRHMTYHRTLRGNAGRLVAGATYRSKKRDYENTLTMQDILTMIWDQKGCCAYSGVAMQMCIPNSHWRMSLERKNNHIRYNISNCVLVAAEFNSSDYSRTLGVRANEVFGTAQWSAEKVSAVFEARRSIVDLHELSGDIAQARIVPKGLARNVSNRRPDCEGNFLCLKCMTHKHYDSFHVRAATSTGIQSYCKECAGDLGRRRRETLRGHVQTLLGNATARSKSANMAFALRLDDLLDMLYLQDGRCIYSGVPLQYRVRHTDWRMSLERLNNLAGYTKDNCMLIAVEFNTSDYSKLTTLQTPHPVSTSLHARPNVLSDLDLQALQPPHVNIEELKLLIQEARNPTCRKPRAARRTANSAGEWLCVSCGRYLPVEVFRLITTRTVGRSYIHSHCNDCERLRMMTYRRTLSGNAERLVASATYRSKKRNHKNTLTKDDILDMIWDQKGCCAYSGIAMQMCIPNSHWRMSLERKDNNLGYNLENCVLVASEFNTSDYSRQRGVRANEVFGTVQWSAEKVSAVFEARRSIVDLHQLSRDITQARVAPTSLARRLAPRRPDCEGKFLCSKCMTHKHYDSFYSDASKSSGIQGFCKECLKDLGRKHRETLRGHAFTLLSSARARSKSANMSFSLQLDDLLDMVHLQVGQCFYSGVPLQYKVRHTDWRMSLERINNSLGYTADNCVLIAVEFNTSDYSRKTAKVKKFVSISFADGVKYCTELQDMRVGFEVYMNK
ncbi:unnamed protein product, partial [Polarella glacialis]